MNDEVIYYLENFEITTDKQRLDIDVIHGFLQTSYWASERPREIIEKSIENSICFGVYHENSQIGFARVISDCAVFAYILDVFIIPEFRGQSLGKWLMQCILNHPQLQSISRWQLATRDAHGLYTQYGFKPLANPEFAMEKRKA